MLARGFCESFFEILACSYWQRVQFGPKLRSGSIRVVQESTMPRREGL